MKPRRLEYSDRAKTAMEWFGKGYRCQQAGDLEAAERAYTRSIALFPTAEAHTFLGWTYSFMNRVEEAIAECERAIRVDPDLGNPYNDIGVYLIRLGREDEAVEWLEKAKKAPRYEARCFPYFNMGTILERKGMLRRALEEYRRALDLEPSYGVARAALLRLQARLLDERGEPGEGGA